jgi:hypothetical protein
VRATEPARSRRRDVPKTPPAWNRTNIFLTRATSTDSTPTSFLDPDRPSWSEYSGEPPDSLLDRIIADAHSVAGGLTET